MTNTPVPNVRILYSLENEQAVLGSCLIAPDGIESVWNTLATEHFYDARHKTIYQVMHDLYSGNDPCDFVTVTDELEKRNQLSQAGDIDYITQLVNAVPTSVNIDYYAKIVIGYARDRMAVSIAGRLAGAAYARQTSQSLDTLIGELLQLQEMDKEAPKIIIPHDDILDKYEQIKKDRINGVSADIMTGFKVIDDWLGGLKRTHSVLIAAQSSTGKSTFARQLLYNIAKQKISVMYITLEMAPVEIVERGIAATANEAHQALHPGANKIQLDTRLMQNGFRDSHGNFFQQLSQYADDSIEWQRKNIAPYLYWSTCAVDSKKLGAIVAQARKRHGIEVFVIDQAQHLTDDNRMLEAQRLTNIASAIADIAMQQEVLMIPITQIKRDTKSVLPSEADIKGSGGYMECADEVIILNYPHLNFPYRPGIDHPAYLTAFEIFGVKARGSIKNVRMLAQNTPWNNEISDWDDSIIPAQDMLALIDQRRDED